MPAVRRGDTSRLIQSEKVKLLILKTTKNSITTYYSTKPDFVPLCRHSCAGPEVAWPQPLGNSRWDTKIHKGSSRKITATRVISDLLGSSLLPSYRVPFVPLLLSHLSPRFSWMPMPWWLRILNLQESNSPKWVLHFQKEVVHEPIEWAFKRRTKVRMLKPWISSSYHNWNTELPEIRTELELRTELEHWETVQKHWELAHDRLMIGSWSAYRLMGDADRCSCLAKSHQRRLDPPGVSPCVKIAWSRRGSSQSSGWGFRPVLTLYN